MARRSVAGAGLRLIAGTVLGLVAVAVLTKIATYLLVVVLFAAACVGLYLLVRLAMPGGEGGTLGTRWAETSQLSRMIAQWQLIRARRARQREKGAQRRLAEERAAARRAAGLPERPADRTTTSGHPPTRTTVRTPGGAPGRAAVPPTGSARDQVRRRDA